jgi:hypothetical protein
MVVVQISLLPFSLPPGVSIRLPEAIFKTKSLFARHNLFLGLIPRNDRFNRVIENLRTWLHLQGMIKQTILNRQALLQKLIVLLGRAPFHPFPQHPPALLRHIIAPIRAFPKQILVLLNGAFRASQFRPLVLQEVLNLSFRNILFKRFIHILLIIFLILNQIFLFRVVFILIRLVIGPQEVEGVVQGEGPSGENLVLSGVVVKGAGV